MTVSPTATCRLDQLACKPDVATPSAPESTLARISRQAIQDARDASDPTLTRALRWVPSPLPPGLRLVCAVSVAIGETVI